MNQYRYNNSFPLILFLLLVGLLPAGLEAAVPHPQECRLATDPVCKTNLKPPFEVVLTPLPDPHAGAMIVLEGRFMARADLHSISLAISAEDGVEASATTIPLSNLSAGGEATFQIPVHYTTGDRSAVRVRASAVSGTQSWERTQALYTLFHNGRTLTGMDSYLTLEIRAIEEDYQAGLLTEEQARAATKQLLRMTGTSDQTPQPREPLTPQEEQLSAMFRPLNPDGTVATGIARDGCITVQGHLSWNDINNDNHPAFGMTVQIWDEDFGFDEFVDVTITDANGDYFIQVNNDDGLGQGDRDIYVKFVTANNAVSIEPAGVFTSPYEADSPVHDETPCGETITENFTCANSGTGPACGINEGGSWIAVFTANDLNGGSFLSQIVIEWPGTGSSSNYDGSDINLLELDRFDWDVIHHEFGHYIQDSFNIEDNPGGPHNIGDCVSDVHDSKDEGVRLAFAEGWPTYNGTVGQQLLNLAALNIPNVGDVRYTDTEDSSLDYSLESQSSAGQGEDNEVAVQRIFWDLFDGPADGRDNVSDSHIALFNALNGADPVNLSQAWGAIRATLSDGQQLGYGAISTDHGVGPSLIGPNAGSIVSPSTNNNFSWNRNVGCSSTYDGDGFSLRFFRTDNAAPILTIPLGNATSASLTLGQFQTLVAATHNVSWAVEGSNSSSPATGPYLGENFAIIVNQPPVADAGADISAECTSPTTTPVALSGTGSADPDGDTLTYAWSAPGVVFDNPNSPTPTGQFPMGTTVVTLVVSDGIEEDSDQVSVTVEDTTPPAIACPADVTIECTDHCEGGGTPADDPQLTEFFDGVSATDVCDPEPEISDNRPDCFVLGTTTVTFTACDDDSNCANCTADVTVVDTTPPEIAVELDRYVLWPPNHKLVTIEAGVTVTDICDPNPTFVLTSITSDEPDEGLGDGDFPDDIQGDELGTPDIVFQLRAERSGLGDGRVYTIIYTASDESGNTATDTVEVTVPHHRLALASGSVGFSETGTEFAPGQSSFALVVLTVPGGPDALDATQIAPGELAIGNTAGVVAPYAVLTPDVNADSHADLVATFTTAEATAIAAQSDELDGPVGLHFLVPGVGAYLVPDIFALGTPLPIDPGLLTGVEEGSTSDDPVGEPGDNAGPAGLPVETALVGIYPNPALPGSVVSFALAREAQVDLSVFDAGGARVRTLLNEVRNAGAHRVAFDGQGREGQRLSGGLYFVRMRTGGREFVRKVIMLQ